MSHLARGLAVAALLTPTASAQLYTYAQDFEAVVGTDPGALTADGWSVRSTVFDPAGNFAYSTGPFGAPNGGPSYSMVVQGLGGAPQGAQSLDVYGDYSAPGLPAGSTVESQLFRGGMITRDEVGETFSFSFDYLFNPNVMNGGATTTAAFIRVIESSNSSFTTLANIVQDTTAASPTTWATARLQVTIPPSWVGETLEYGFECVVPGAAESNRVYDNLSFSSPGSRPPSLERFSEDFESSSGTDPGALQSREWSVFAEVADSSGVPLYAYGPFPAPNGGASFSSIASDGQSAAQGERSLAVFSDYANGDHGNGFFVSGLVYQERMIHGLDVGRTMRLSFDYLEDPLGTNPGAQSTAEAFLAVIDRANPFAGLITRVDFDTTLASTSSWASGAVELTIQPSWAGQLLRFGFESTATNYEDSTRLYDNLAFGPVPIGSNYCVTSINSSGGAATISAIGSELAADNNLLLIAEGMPPGQFGIFAVSATQGQQPLGNGAVCLSGAIGRFQGPGQIQATGTTGSFGVLIDLSAIPLGGGPVSTQPGQTWNFQAWFREGVGAGSNLSDGVSVTFR